MSDITDKLKAKLAFDDCRPRPPPPKSVQQICHELAAEMEKNKRISLESKYLDLSQKYVAIVEKYLALVLRELK